MCPSAGRICRPKSSVWRSSFPPVTLTSRLPGSSATATRASSTPPGPVSSPQSSSQKSRSPSVIDFISIVVTQRLVVSSRPMRSIFPHSHRNNHSVFATKKMGDRCLCIVIRLFFLDIIAREARQQYPVVIASYPALV